MREPGADWKATEPARRQVSEQRGPHKACMPKRPKEQEPKSHNKVSCDGSVGTISAVWLEQERCFQDVGKCQI